MQNAWIFAAGLLLCACSPSGDPRNSGRIVTTDEAWGEYLTFFASASETLRRRAATSVQRILANRVIRSRSSLLAGLDLYRDCISMQTMRTEGLTEALTNDRHYVPHRNTWSVIRRRWRGSE